MKTFIHNAKLINEGISFEGYLQFEKGIITVICKGKPESLPDSSDTLIIDAGGKWLIPGIIDDQVHFREPGLTHKADIYTESRAAAAGGITSFMEMPNTLPQTITNELLKEKFNIGASQSLVNYSFYFGATNDNIEEIKKVDPYKACGIKVFMGASTGNMLVDKPDALETIFSFAKIPVAVHCEEEAVISKQSNIYRAKYGEEVPVEYHPHIRNHEACLISSTKAVQLARKHNTRLHLLHLSTADELALLTNDIPLNEKRITAEVCVHHLWFTDKDYSKLGSLIKWNPAVKTLHDRDALRQGLINDLLDVVATDHAPHTLDEKQKPYFSCPSGAPLVQFSLQTMVEMHFQGIFSMEKIVEKMCHNPAICFQLEKRGFLRKGYYADLVLLDPQKAFTVNPGNILSKCGWSPLSGTTFQSSVTHTFVNGILVFENGNIINKPGAQALTFNR